jgi:hypothetical protein
MNKTEDRQGKLEKRKTQYSSRNIEKVTAETGEAESGRNTIEKEKKEKGKV